MTSALIRRKYYIITGAHTLAASLIWGVNTLFLLDSGLNIYQVFLVNAVFTASMTLFEIPTGAVADSRGRRVSLRWSSVMLFIGTLGYLAAGTWGGGIPAFIAASSLLGLGFTFFSGAAEAWAVDELKYYGDEGGSTSLFANAATASSIMMLGGTIAGGLLGSLDYRIPYLLRAGLFLFMLGITIFAMPENGWEHDGEILSATQRIRRTAADSVRYGLKIVILRRLMGVSFILGIFMMWGFYAFQPYITSLAGMPGAAWLSGMVTAALTLSQILGQRLAIQQEKPRAAAAKQAGTLVARAMAVAAFGAMFAGIAGFTSIRSSLGLYGASIMALCGMMLMMGSLGYSGPFLRNALHSRIPSNKRATIASLDSLVGSGGAIVGQPMLGRLAARFSIASGYLAGAVLFVLTQPVLAMFRRSEREENHSSHKTPAKG